MDYGRYGPHGSVAFRVVVQRTKRFATLFDCVKTHHHVQITQSGFVGLTSDKFDITETNHVRT